MVQLYRRQGGDSLVNTQTNLNQSTADLAVLAGGGYVVVWTDASLIGGDSSVQGIKGQIFDSDGDKVGGEFLVNTTIPGAQAGALVAALPSGRFVATWSDPSSTGGDTSGFAVRAQMFEANGTPVGTEFLVNTETASNQTPSAITSLAGGGFIISWTDASGIGGDSSSTATKAQLFDAGGTKVGGEILVNTVTQGSQSQSTLVALPTGGFAVAWVSNSLAAPVQVSVKLQLFDSAGAKIGGETIVNGITGVNFNRPNIAALPDGFLVTWAQQDNPGVIAPNPITYDVRAQKFDFNGAKVGSEFVVNVPGTGTQFGPDAAALPGGGYIVTWQSAVGSSGSDVIGQIFDSAGSRVGTQFVVSSNPAGNQFNPKVGVLPSGEVVLVWTTDGPSEGDNSGIAVNSTILTPSSAPPTDIALSATSLTENATENVAVATVSATGAVNSSFTYSIRSDSTGGAFRLEGDKLVVHDNAKLDFETAPQAAVTIRVTDLNGQTYDEQLVLGITDIVNEKRYSAGDEMLVNVNQMGGQSGATVIPLAGGGYAMVWSEYNPVPGDSTPQSTLLRLYNSAGEPQSGEIVLADSSIPDLHAVPLANGGFMLIGDPVIFPGGQRVIKAQGFDSVGNPAGPEIILGGFQYHFAAPVVAELDNGDFVIAWAAFPDNDIRARRFDSDGTAIGGEFTITTELSATPISLVATPNGGFAASWISTEGNPEEGDSDEATVRFFDSGNMPGATLSVDIGTDSGSLSLLALADGGYLLGWRELVGEDESGLTLQAVMGQRIGANGSAIGEPILLAGYVNYSDSGEVDFASAPDGGFVATWPMIGGTIVEGQVTYFFNSLEGRLFDSSGSPIGEQFQASAMTSGQSNVGVLADGSIVFAWSGNDSSESGSFARVFRPANAPVDNSGNDILTGDANPNRLDGGAGDDQLYGLGGDDTLIGGAGRDALYGGPGADRMEGGSGDDVHHVDNAGDVVVELVDEGSDTVATSISYTLTANVENLQAANIGGTDPLSLTGNALANFIWGTQGNNVIDGRGGADFMIGYAGDDVYHVDHSGDLTYEESNWGADTVVASVSYRLGANIENLQALDIAGTAALALTGNAQNNFIWGTQGNNVIDGGAGADFLIGYAGDDIYHVDHGGDVAYELEGGGLDTVVASFSYTLAANVENLQALNIGGSDPLALTGNDLRNFIWGTQGNNVLDGGAGADVMIGYGGNDVYFVDNAGDVTYEEVGGGSDTVAALASYTIGANIENLQAANMGGNAALSLTGNDQNNFIWGTQGSNVLSGRGGNDRIFGFAGADQFLFDTAAGSANADWLDDFQAGTDKILLDNAVFTALSDGALPSNAFVTGTSALDADDRIIFDAASGSLYYDSDGNGLGSALLIAVIPVGQALTAADISVV